MNPHSKHPLADPIRAFMDRAGGLPSWEASEPSLDEAFNTLALGLYAWQWHHNDAMAALHGPFPDPQHWSEIPPLPCAAFQELEMSCLPPEQRLRAFVSSGTTGHHRSRHWHDAESLRLYEHSLWTGFRHRAGRLLEDAGLIMLTPPPDSVPESSLIHMLGILGHRSGCNTWFAGELDAATSQWMVSMDRLIPGLLQRQSEGRRIALLGTAFHFVHLTDHLESIGATIPLPPGSWIMETGGYKGRSRNVPRPELLRRLARHLGIQPDRVIGEYGMCELGSQAYDIGTTVVMEGDAPCPVYRFPPWARARVISTENEKPVANGETGLLQVVDLANAWSALSIRTGDLVRRQGQGFEILGRAPASVQRGCSLNLEEIPTQA